RARARLVCSVALRSSDEEVHLIVQSASSPLQSCLLSSGPWPVSSGRVAPGSCFGKDRVSDQLTGAARLPPPSSGSSRYITGPASNQYPDLAAPAHLREAIAFLPQENHVASSQYTPVANDSIRRWAKFQVLCGTQRLPWKNSSLPCFVNRLLPANNARRVACHPWQ